MSSGSCASVYRFMALYNKSKLAFCNDMQTHSFEQGPANSMFWNGNI